MKPEELLPAIEERFFQGLHSVVLYGSAATEQFHPDVSDFNLLILTDQPCESNPLAGHKLMKPWLKKNPPPLLWDIEFFKTSVDVFPLEFLEIKNAHRILLGKALPEINVHPNNLRHQCEMELRSKYLQLLNHPLHLLGKDKALFEVLLKSLSSVMALMQGPIYLLGKTPEKEWRRRVEQVAMISDIHPDIFLELIDMREKKIPKPRKKEIPEKVEAFLTQLKRLIRFIDTMEVL